MNDAARNLAEEIVNGQILLNWRIYLFVICAYILRVIFDNFFGPYSKARGELRSLKEDFKDFKTRLAETTNLTKSIEMKFAHSDWALRENKMLRRAKLEDMITAMYEAEAWMSAEIKNALFNSPPNSTRSPIDRFRMLGNLYFPELDGELNDHCFRYATLKMDVITAFGKVKDSRDRADEPGPIAVREERSDQHLAEIQAQKAIIEPQQIALVYQAEHLTRRGNELMKELIKAES